MLIGFVFLVMVIGSSVVLVGLCRAAQRADAAEEQHNQQRVGIE